MGKSIDLNNSYHFKLAADSSFNHIIITDTEGIILYANDSVSRITGYTRDEIIGKTPKLWGGVNDKGIYVTMWKTIKGEKKPYTGELKNRRKDGRVYWAKIVISPILDESKELVGFIGTEEDITAEKEIDRMKTEFISLASHQLRTPLTAVRWFSELLSGTSLDDTQKKYLGKVRFSNEKSIELVNTLLNISRIESGRLIINPALTDINKLAEESIEQIKPQADKKNIKITLFAACTIPEINIDPGLVRQVFINLLTNSVKYSNSGTEVKIVLSVKDENVLIEIADSGIGIPLQEQGKIFVKFFRASNAVYDFHEGNGLGLYLIKSIIDMSGGKIWFKSPSDSGKGTAFWFTLPLSGSIPKTGEVTLS